MTLVVFALGCGSSFLLGLLLNLHATETHLRHLLERARDDLVHGWPEAALDALGRALRLLEGHEPQ